MLTSKIQISQCMTIALLTIFHKNYLILATSAMSCKWMLHPLENGGQSDSLTHTLVLCYWYFSNNQTQKLSQHMEISHF